MILNNENYYSPEANQEYMSVSQYKAFMNCEAAAMASISGKYERPTTRALLVGSFVDRYFEGTLNEFLKENPALYTRKHELRAEFKRANQIIETVKTDPKFMDAMSGEKQRIFTFELFGVKWKAKLDSYNPGKAITDLKVVARMDKLPMWRYDLQGAIYQKGVEIVTGEKLPFYLAVVTKERVMDSLEAEGYVAASELVKNINKLEDAIDDVLDADSLEFLEKIEAATGVTDFITDIWPEIKDADDLEKALREIFRKQFDDMFREFTYQWVLAEDPVLATEVEEITKPAEAFIQGWSGELARIMNLNTKDAMERLLLKAQEKKWSIDELSEAIGNSGIREHGYRSRRVALTESLRVESYAQQESMIQNPLAYKKKWKHVMSAHPRENHMAMDGQEVFKRETFTLTGKNGTTYMVLCPRDTSLPVEETANCHCLMETIADENALGMTAEERAAARKKYMDEVNAEYDAWEKKFKEDTGIEEPRDDPSVTWKIYNSYYEA